MPIYTPEIDTWSDADVHQAATRDYDSQTSARQLNTALNCEPAKQRRNRIAEGFAFALAPSSNLSKRGLALKAIDMADALIAELDRK